jgi:hypothetical protein
MGNYSPRIDLSQGPYVKRSGHTLHPRQTTTYTTPSLVACDSDQSAMARPRERSRHCNCAFALQSLDPLEIIKERRTCQKIALS